MRLLHGALGPLADLAISVFGEVGVNTLLPFLYPTFEASPSEFEISLSKGCAGTYVSRSSRFSVKGCNQSGMPCVGCSSFISSSFRAEPRFPEARLSGLVCISFPHARLALRVVIGSDDVSDSPEEFD